MTKLNTKNLNKGFSIFVVVYAVLSILFSFYNLTVVRNSLFSNNADSLDIQTYQLYLRFATVLERYSSIIIYSIIIAILVLFVQFFKDYYKKKDHKKIEVTKKMKHSIIVTTVVFVVLFLFCGILQNIMFDRVVSTSARAFCNFWEFPTSFLIPFILAYVYKLCTIITKE